MQKGQAEALMPLLEGLLAEVGLRWPDLGAIGVGTGPGSFTGTRIAVSAARGLSLGLGIPAVGVGILEGLAEGLRRPVTVAFGPRPGEVARQVFDPDPGPVEALTGDAPPVDPAAIAIAIARVADRRRDAPGPRPAPVYLRPADAAPARDRGPAILPG